MAERYRSLYRLSPNLYTPGSPVVIAAGALLQDTKTGKLLAQLKIKNIQGIPVKMVTAEIIPLDPVGRLLGGPVVHKYMDLHISRDSSFGTQEAIPIACADTRSMEVRITEVCFADNTVWSSNGAWTALPDLRPIETLITDSELVKQYQLTYGVSAQYRAEAVSDLWYCTCGEVNRKAESNCHRCKNAFATVSQPNLAELEKAKETRLAEEARQRELAEEKRKAEAEKARIEAAKRKKRLGIFLASVTMIAVVIYIITQVIVPNIKHKNALEMMEAGSYAEAFVAFEALDGYKDSAEKAESMYKHYKNKELRAVSVGEIVCFGTYEQDNDTANGAEGIQWRVLAKEEDRVLLISEYALEARPYNNNYKDVTWETCTLRSWLNDRFYNTAFTSVEQALILTTTVKAHQGPWNSADPGKDTQDKVFLLSVQEAEQYFSSDKARMCVPTAYALNQGVWTKDGYAVDDKLSCWWWLRSPGYDRGDASGVNIAGGTLSANCVDTEGCCVRPAMWIDLDA